MYEIGYIKWDIYYRSTILPLLLVPSWALAITRNGMIDMQKHKRVSERGAVLLDLEFLTAGSQRSSHPANLWQAKGSF